MNQCVRILIEMEIPKNFLQNFIQKHARSLKLEGIAQLESPSQIKVILCGLRDDIDVFIDQLHKKSVKQPIKNLEIEPFIKNKDYRGVFRVIE